MEQQPTKRVGPIYWLKGRSRRFWLIMAALLPVFYVASFGPACWAKCWLNKISTNHFEPPVIYFPLTRLVDYPEDRKLVGGMLYRYSLLGTDGSWDWWHASIDDEYGFPKRTDWRLGRKPSTPNAAENIHPPAYDEDDMTE